MQPYTKKKKKKKSKQIKMVERWLSVITWTKLLTNVSSSLTLGSDYPI
jgi:hypothetical protein